MASCENCKRSGIPPEQMMVVGVSQVPGAEKILIGPCCIGAPVEPQMNYHFELSSKRGLIATMSFGGLSLQYKKSPEELRQVFSPADMQQEDPTLYQH